VISTDVLPVIQNLYGPDAVVQHDEAWQIRLSFVPVN